MPSLYILHCIDGSYYIGSTLDQKKRYQDHLQGKCRYTKSRLPVRLIHLENYHSLSEARKRERQIKSWKSRKMIEKLIRSSLKAPSSNGSGH